jgi:hypothetical protein
VVNLMVHILLATTSLGIFSAVKLIYKQRDINESLYLRNVLLLIFYPCFEDCTVFIVVPNVIGVISVGTSLFGVSSFSTQYEIHTQTVIKTRAD